MKTNIIKICLIIITIAVLGSFLMSSYYNMKYIVGDHNERKTVCDNKELIYLKSA